jgi:hypothetical protein
MDGALSFLEISSNGYVNSHLYLSDAWKVYSITSQYCPHPVEAVTRSASLGEEL